MGLLTTVKLPASRGRYDSSGNSDRQSHTGIIGTLEASIIIVMAVTWFEITLLGSLAGLYLGILLFAFAVIGIGLMISSLAVTQQQGLLGAFLFIVPAVILSGYVTPIVNLPALVQALTLVHPLRYLLIILHGVFLEVSTINQLFDQYWPLVIIGMVGLSSAGRLFGRKLY